MSTDMNERIERTSDERTDGPEYRVVESCEIEIPPPCALVIFGASGDLTKRKLIPSLYRLFKSGMLPDKFFVLGTSRVEMSTEQFRKAMMDAVKDAFGDGFDKKRWQEFSERLYYTKFDYAIQESYITNLRDKLPALESKHETEGNRIFYLAIPPTVFDEVIRNLGAAGLSREDKGCSHVVIEKPFGRDLTSARRLNRLVHTYFKESQIFRIDHYLAKETVQNIFMFRFANSIFEPLWNRRYIDHVQIIAAETIGVEHRSGYYEQAGVIRDMFQNHMLQLLALTAMEPPPAFEADPVRDEKAKVFRSMHPVPLNRLNDYVAIGQYDKGIINGEPIIGYREETGVSPKSGTPTFAAMKVFIDNWRWNGVPFYLRSGKRLLNRKTEISIHFKQVPHSMFPETVAGPIEPNTLVLNVQPEEGINLTFQTKQPGSKVCLNPAAMNFSYPRGVLLDAYEWVVLDCMIGDRMLFTREDSVEETWRLLMPMIETLEAAVKDGNIPRYAAGSDGPPEAARLIARDGRAWRPL
jgi:glucose-6-phosphate 1-dehydrogenase